MIARRFVACLLAAALGPTAAAAQAISQPLAPGVRWIPGEFVPGKQPDSNSLLFDAPDGMIVFDTGRSAAHAEQIAQAVRGTGKPLKFIINSHWHLDHIGGNGPLRRAFDKPTVIASAAIGEARTGFLARYRQQIEQRLPALPASSAERSALLHELEIIDDRADSTPDIVVDRSTTRMLAGHAYQLGLAAHAATAGDVWLFDPASRVLAAGDLVTLPAPLLDTACPAAWQRAMDRLADVRFDWLVPGHGAPMRRAGFDTYRRAYGRLLQCAASPADKQQCMAGWLKDAHSLIPSTDEPLARTLLDYYLDNVLRKPEAQARLDCPAA